jgi:hypothetical protein
MGNEFVLASAFGLESSGTLSWAAICYLTGWLPNDILIFFLPGLLEDASLVVSKNLQFHLQRTIEKISGSGRMRFREVEVEVQLHGSSVAESNSDRDFHEWTSDASQDCGRFRGKPSSVCENGRCQQVKACLWERRAAHCRPSWTGWRPLGMLIVTTRRHLIVICIIIIIIIIIIILLWLGVYPVAVDLTLIQRRKDYT